MKLSRLRESWGIAALLFIERASVVQATGYVSTATFDSSSCDTAHAPSLWKTTNLAAADCSSVTALTSTSTCTQSGSPYTITVCSTDSSYSGDATTAFGSAYVTINSYSSSDNTCLAVALSGISTYLADGNCHIITGGSFKAVTTSSRTTVKTYTDTACSAGETVVLDATAAQLGSNSCSANTIPNKKVTATGTTPMYFTSTATYDSSTSSCGSSVVPAQWSSTAIASTTCTSAATATCTASSAPYTRVVCSASLSAYYSSATTLFGANSGAYVTIESYTAGKLCAPTDLASVVTYEADGNCHITGSGSFKAVTTATRTVVKTYTDTACSAGENVVLDATAAQLTTNDCTANGVLNKKVTATGTTPMYLTSTATYDSSTSSCGGSVVPAQWSSTAIASTTCTSVATATCTASSAPYTRVVCSASLSAYYSSATTLFGANSGAYVTIESYTASKLCAPTDLASIVTFEADGNCHITGSGSFKAVTTATRTSVKTYTDTACSAGETVVLDATAAQLTTNDCTANGVLDKKVTATGTTPMYFTSTATYDASTSSCGSSVVPAQWSSTAIASTACTSVATATCTASSAPYTRVVCSASLSAYYSSATSLFGSNAGSQAYVTVESYVPTQSCALTDLVSIVTYAADGACHVTGSGSFKAVTTATRTSVKTYTDTACSAGEAVVVDATAAQLTTNDCTANGVLNKKVTATGTTPMYFTSTATYDASTSSCGSSVVPAQWSSTAIASTTCTSVATATCTASSAPYTRVVCSASLSAYYSSATSLFGSNAGSQAYVTVESYVPTQSCALTDLVSIVTYAADGACHVTGSGSFKAVTTATRTSVKTYTDTACSAGEAVVVDATAAQLTTNDCTANGVLNKKVTATGTTPMYFTSTATYDASTSSCGSSVVPAQWSSTAIASTTCTSVATATCTASSAPYTRVVCSASLSAYYSSATSLFGSNAGSQAYVTVESYVPTQSCALTDLVSIVTYAADGACHVTGSGSFKAVTTATRTSVKTYTDTACSAGEAVVVDATAAQLTTNDCTANGVLNKKVTATGTTPMYFTSTATYDASTSSCGSSVVPAQWSSTAIASTTCTSVATATCTASSAPYTRVVCSASLSAYYSSATSLFGSNAGSQAYVTVESYVPTQSCALTDLVSIVTYAADGACHVTGSGSFKAVTTATRTVVKTYTDTACSAGEVVVVDATAAQLTTNDCTANGVLNKKVTATGTTSLFYTSTATYDASTSSCGSTVVPAQWSSTAIASTTCTSAATATCTATAAPFTRVVCNPSSSYYSAATALFGLNSGPQAYVTVEAYTPGKFCAPMDIVSITTYEADGKCHITGSGSFKAVTTAIRTVVKTYTDTACSAGEVVVVDATAAQLTTNDCTAANGVLDKKVTATGTSPAVFYTSTATYDASTSSCGSTVVPAQWSSTAIASTTCTSAATATCTATAAPFTRVVCNPSSSYYSAATALFGLNSGPQAYVTVEAYTPGKFCAPMDIVSITTYEADGKCHITGSGSFKAVTTAIRTVVKTYTDTACSAGEVVVVDATAAQLTTNDCTAANGVLDKKVTATGTSPAVFYTSTATYDASTSSCGSTVVPAQWSSTAIASTTCTSAATATCTATAAPFTRVVCNPSSSYYSAATALFGLNSGPQAYVTVEAYTPGKFCAPMDIVSITTYEADGKCHITGSGSFKAVTTATRTVVKTYTDTACSAGEVVVVDATAAQLTTNDCTAANGVLDKKVTATGTSPAVFYTSTATYDASTSSCGSTVVPAQWSSTAIASTTCTSAATATCTATAAPFTRVVCNPSSSYYSAATALFGLNSGPQAYVTVEAYTPGKFCAPMDIVSITTYEADGKCHVTGTSSSFKALRTTSRTVVKTYADTLCGGGEVVVVDATAAQLTTNDCTAANGVLDKKVTATGVTPAMFYTSTATYDASTSSCGSTVVPAQWSSTAIASTTCTSAATATCTATAAPFTRVVCNPSTTYYSAIAASFGLSSGSQAYVTVESYVPSQSCALTDLVSIVTYAADGNCHVTGSGSFKAVTTATRTVVKTYTDTACSAGEVVVVDATAAQLTTNDCTAANGVLDKKVTATGTSPAVFYTSTATYDASTSSCGSTVVPAQWSSTAIASTTCTSAATATCTATAAPFTRVVCNPSSSYYSAATALFGLNSGPQAYVTVEAYTPGKFCAPMDIVSITTYEADGKCHITGSGSFKAVTTATRTVVKTYTDTACSAGEVVVVDATAAQLTTNDCTAANGVLDKKVTATGTSPAVFYTSTATYDASTSSCGSTVVPAQWSSTAIASTTCTSAATATCTATAAPFTRVVCNPSSSYYSAATALFGLNSGPQAYVTVESYTAGKACAPTDLTGIVTFLADGKCHITGSGSFKAVTTSTRTFVKTYTDTACSAGDSVVVNATAALLATNNCTAAGGVVDKMVYPTGSTVLYVTSTATYDTNSCGNTAIPAQWSSTAIAPTTCTSAATATCTATTAPFTRVVCNPSAAYYSAATALFGSQAYVAVESYVASKQCAPTELTSIVTYEADGKCHITGSGSFKAVTTATRTVVKTYTDTACSAGEVVVVDATAAQLTTNDCTAANGVLDKKVTATGTTSLFYTSTATYDASTSSCGSTVVPAQWSSTAIASTTCTSAATATCTATAAPFTRVVCNPSSSYYSAATALFGLNSGPQAYVTVEAYAAGKKCAPTDLVSVTTYAADGKCHITGSGSFKAVTTPDRTVVKSYTDTACSNGMSVVLRANASQLTTNDCGGGATGVLDKKVYLSTANTPLALTTTASYDSNTGNCASTVPSQWSIAVTGNSTCTSIATCGSAPPYQRKLCSSTISTYRNDIPVAFPATPFVTVESYATGQNCAVTDLTGIVTYEADGVCHTTGNATSFIATLSLSGAVKIVTYSASTSCNDTTGAASNTLIATVSQTRGNSCAGDANGIKDKLVFGMSPRYLSAVAAYDGATCGTPAQISIANTTTCTPASCIVIGNRSLAYDCLDDSYAYARSSFGTTPYVVTELYAQGSNCATPQGILAYAADANCHAGVDGASSFTATLGTDGSASLMMYSGVMCSGTATNVTLASGQLANHTCVGNSKYYAFQYIPTQAPVPTTVTPTTTPATTTAPASTTAAPTPTTTTSTGTAKSAASSLFSVGSLLAIVLAWLSWVAVILL